jgi:hypothetical protein
MFIHVWQDTLAFICGAHVCILFEKIKIRSTIMRGGPMHMHAYLVPTNVHKILKF